MARQRNNFGKSDSYPNYGFGNSATNNRYYGFNIDFPIGGSFNRPFSGGNSQNKGFGRNSSFGGGQFADSFSGFNSSGRKGFGQTNRFTTQSTSGKKKSTGGGGRFNDGGVNTDEILRQLGQYFLSNFTTVDPGGSIRYQPYGMQPIYGQRYPYNHRFRYQKNVRKGHIGGLGKKKGKKVGAGGGQVSTKGEEKQEKKGKKLSSYMSTLHKYSSIRNKFIDEDKIVVFLYLRVLFTELYAVDDEMHFILSSFITRHHNAIKLLMYECKNGLDKKFGSVNTTAAAAAEVKQNKLEFLTNTKANLVEHLQKIKKFKTDPTFDEKVERIDECFDALVGENFGSNDVPTIEDYITDKEKNKNDYFVDVKFTFLKGCYEQLFYRLFDNSKSKNNDKRLAFHLKNGFMPLMIVEKIRSKANVVKRPPMLEKYSEERKDSLKEKTTKTSNMIYDTLVKNNEQMQTQMSDYIGRDKYPTTVHRDFADCILFFDKIASVVKVKLVKYTPYCAVSSMHKEKIINDLVSSIYKECLNILKNNIQMSDKEYVDMEKSEEDLKNEATLEESESKN